MNTGKALHWLARTALGNIVVVLIGIAGGIALTLVAVTLAAESSTDAPRTDKVVHQLVDTTTEPGAPSVNLTPNDPGYMTTAPAITETATTGTDEPTPAPSATEPATTPTDTTQAPVTPTTTATETARPTTPQVAPTSPQADPNIIPLVIAWDGLKCPKPDSFYVQTHTGPMLMCPGSITP